MNWYFYELIYALYIVTKKGYNSYSIIESSLLISKYLSTNIVLSIIRYHHHELPVLYIISMQIAVLKIYTKLHYFFFSFNKCNKC
jgi:hypothetical protein